MAASILQNALILVNGIDLSGHSNAVAVDFGAETLDDTVFGDDTRSMCGGLKTAGLGAEGFYNTDVDGELFSDIGAAGGLISVAPSRSVGDRAFAFQALAHNLNVIEGEIGALAQYSLDAAANGSLTQGSLLLHAPSVSVSGDGSGLNEGAATTQVTAFLHVFSVSGSSPTLDVIVQSDADNTFSTPASQITFTQATAVGAERIVSVGAVADTWWRVNYTLSGGSPVFGFAVILIVE